MTSQGTLGPKNQVARLQSRAPCPAFARIRGLRSLALHGGSRLQRIGNVSPSWIMIVTALVASLCACLVKQDVAQHGRRDLDLSSRVIKIGDPVPKGGGVYKLGDPYIAAGKWFVPVNDQSYDQVGITSGTAISSTGRRTANGEIYDMNALTAAHPTLPMPTYATVTNLANLHRTIGPRSHQRPWPLSRWPYHRPFAQGGGAFRPLPEGLRRRARPLSFARAAQRGRFA